MSAAGMWRTRSVSMNDRRVCAEDLAALCTAFSDDEDLVFAHPEPGAALDRTKVTVVSMPRAGTAGVRRGEVLNVRRDGDYGLVEPPPVVPAAS